MAYIVPIHRPSSVRHALKLQLLEPDNECLVVAKANRLEIYTQNDDDALTLQHSRAIYGKVTILNKIRPASSSTDHLFVGTDRFMYFTLSWDPGTRQFRTERSYVDLAERTARESQTGDRSHIDPSGRFMTLEVFEGIITVLPIVHKSNKSEEIGMLGEPMPARIEELFVRSSAFLQRDGRNEKQKPQLALVYQDSHSKVRLKITELWYTPAGKNDTGGVEFKDLEGGDRLLELGASHLIPISEPVGGLLILGETSITYYHESQNDLGAEPLVRPLDEATIFCAWAQVDNQRFVLADDYGRLYLLMLMVDDDGAVDHWQLDIIGETSRASTLVYLDAGHIFVGSHQGDSQVIRIQERSMEVIQTFSNIAPILDFTIMDLGNRSGEGQTNEYSSGQARIVTGSGAWKDGSLRSVRSGVGLEDLGMLGEMNNITDVFSVQSNASSLEVDTLIVTFIDETRIFRFSDDGEVEEVADFAGLSLNQQTLHASSLPQGRLLQVTSSAAKLTEVDSGMTVAEWTPSDGEAITAVSATSTHLLLSVGSTDLTVLDLSNNFSVIAQKSYPAQGQIACITISPSMPSIALVGFWANAQVSIVDLSTLDPIHTTVVVDEANVSVPRSLLLTHIFSSAPPTLFIAMADGNVITYSLDPKSFALSGRKSIVLGTQQASFKELPRGDGLSSVFAVCEQPSLIYASEGRLVYSTVTAEKATCVCAFDAVAYPDAVAIATNEDLRIALIDKERTTHVQTLIVNETVRRIAYSGALKVFGMGTIKRTLVDGAEIVESSFKIVDEIVFRELDDYSLNRDELVESVMRCELEDGNGGLSERFVVGTAYLEEPGEGDVVKGRMLVFEVTEDRVLKLVTENAVKGACRCLAMSQGRIVAGLMKTIAVYQFQHQHGSSPTIERKAAYRTSTAPIDLTIAGDIIAVADLMKSVSLLHHEAGRDADILKEVAGHFQAVWGTSVAEVGENKYLESDAEGNLLLMARQVDGVTEEDKRTMRVEAEMNLGEMVNRMRKVDVAAAETAVVAPKAFLATVEGSIYLFALITRRYLNLLMELQTILTDYVQSPGLIPFDTFRAYKTQVRQMEAPVRFVDGELVEKFLDMPADIQEEVADKLKGITTNMDVGGEGQSLDAEWFRSLIEGLRRLH
ncbi:hypothetical protein NA57DRAFT_72308 [Rhizodiscina lignyota]|uniref:DNA damage-binding protein 1 n=1 Tax=Rhizodiscina lignyota TaxID=1504668 RepID=A0A9P4MDC5_9PEZI|nr:hypothetical protein NA57DRAFT_72308 [Rhizodiscina lignyota]